MHVTFNYIYFSTISIDSQCQSDLNRHQKCSSDRKDEIHTDVFCSSLLHLQKGKKGGTT